MKTFYIIFFLISFSKTLFAQIPNAGFENWTGAIPDNWFSQTGYSYVAPDSNAHSGNLAMKFQTVQGSSGVSATTISTRVAPNSSYYPIGTTSIPLAVSFYAITNLMNGDLLTFNTSFKKESNIIGTITGTCVSTVSPTYQLYTFPVNYSTSGILPDSAATWFSFRNTTCTPNLNTLRAGTFALIDDLEFNFTTGIDEERESANMILSPNPAQNKLCLSLQSTSTQKSKLEIINLAGAIVHSEFVELSNTKCSKELDLSNFENGFYILRLTPLDGSRIARERFVVQR